MTRLRTLFLASTALACGALLSSAHGAPVSPPSSVDMQAIYKAMGLKKRSGKLVNSCGESVKPEVETVDLNADGKPEVFVTVSGSCYGMAGAELSLFIKDRKGRLQRNLGFPAASYRLLDDRNEGYPDIEIGGPGICAPVWRWNGMQYTLHKGCEG